jgi:cation diffusion facilitator family transporter
VKEVSAKKVILTSFFVDLLDIVTNVIVAVITGSIVMTTESIQGFADITAVSLIYLGFRKGRKVADATHPLGYGRELYFWTLLSSIMMMVFTATISFYLGFLRFIHPEPIDNLVLAYGVLTLSILSNGYAMSLDIRRITNNSSSSFRFKHFFNSEHIETKTTFVLDLMGTSVAICGLISLLLLKFTNNLQFDGIGAMVMGFVLASLSFILIKGAKDLLIGKAASPDTNKKIKSCIDRFSEVKQIIRLQTVYEGSGKVLVLLDLHLKNDLKTDQIERLTQKIKDSIQSEVPSVYNVQIELSEK